MKGPRVHGSDTEQGSFEAGVPLGHFIKPSKGLLKLMKKSPGKYKLVSKIYGTDSATGAVDVIRHTFRLKR